MLIFIFLMIIFFKILYYFILSVKENLEKIKRTELLEKRSEISDLELKIVAFAQPLRCLEFMFNGSLTPTNYRLDCYSQEQIIVLKEVLSENYFIENYEDLKFYDTFIQFKLIMDYFSVEELSKIINQDMTPSLISEDSEITSVKNLMIVKSMLALNLSSFKETVDFIQKYTKAQLRVVDETYFTYIELLYKTHIYSLAYEVGYLSKKELFATFSTLENIPIDWTFYDQVFTYVNELFKTGSFVLSRINKKKNKVCWGKYGVWQLQQEMVSKENEA